jgi:hypothetical protein
VRDRWKLLPLIAALAATGPLTGQSSEPVSRADWLHAASFGAFMHVLPSDATTLAEIGKFDVEALAQQLVAGHVKYFVVTLGQNSGYFNAPNATYDRITGYRHGERCSPRDLPLELHRALSAHNIRLLLYLPSQTPNEDARAQKAFGLPEGAADQPIDTAFARQWADVIREWSTRYGEKVSGWWFDGGYESVHFNEAIAGIYAEAARAGNRDAIVTFNPGVGLKRHTRAEDYTAGELNEPFTILPASRFVNGSQWHALTYHGSTWARRDIRYPTDRWRAWFKQVVARGGAVTFDVGPNWDPRKGPIGAIDIAQLEQLRAIGHP